MICKDNSEQLKEGIFLDKENIRIPWQTSIEDLHQFGNPEVLDEGKKPSGLIFKTPYKKFVWKNRFWCGFKCHIDTTLYNRDAKQLKNISDDLIWYYSSVTRYFYINTISGDVSNNVRDEYKKLKNIFINEFGKPVQTEVKIEYGRDYPWNLWRIENIQLTLAMQERFLDFNTIMVRYL